MKKPKHIGLRYVLAWIFGVLFILVGAGSLANSIIGGLLIILGAVIILPPFGNFIEKKYHYHLSGWLKLVIFLVLVGIGISLTSTGEDVPVPDNKEVISEVQKPSEQDAGGDAESAKFSLKILDKKTFDFVGSSGFGKTASGKFLVYEIEIENLDSEPIYITSNDIRLFDEQGRKFVPDVEAMIYSQDPFVFETINPGITQRGVVIFDVPDPKAEFELKVYDNVLGWID